MPTKFLSHAIFCGFSGDLACFAGVRLTFDPNKNKTNAEMAV